jgi:hypothetical protein
VEIPTLPRQFVPAAVSTRRIAKGTMVRSDQKRKRSRLVES